MLGGRRAACPPSCRRRDGRDHGSRNSKSTPIYGLRGVRRLATQEAGAAPGLRCGRRDSRGPIGRFSRTARRRSVPCEHGRGSTRLAQAVTLRTYRVRRTPRSAARALRRPSRVVPRSGSTCGMCHGTSSAATRCWTAPFSQVGLQPVPRDCRSSAVNSTRAAFAAIAAVTQLLRSPGDASGRSIRATGRRLLDRPRTCLNPWARNLASGSMELRDTSRTFSS